MIISESQKQAIFSIFSDAGFRNYDQSKFHFEGGHKKTSMNTFLKQLGSPECFKTEELALLGLAFMEGKFPVKEFMTVVKEWSQTHAKVIPTLEVEGLEEDEGEEDNIAYVHSLIPTINITKHAKDKVILLDPHKNNRPALDIDSEYYMLLTGNSYEDMVRNKDIRRVMTCFDPYTLKSLFIKDSKTNSIRMYHVNYYVAPAWRFNKTGGILTGFIEDLIDHLFPNPEEREYVLDWLHYAIIKRNETVLCLIGARGTGKGLLLNNILEQLIGTEYHEIAKQEVLTEKFNSEFKNKRHVYFDEVDISGDKEITRFRALANHKISVEAKGEDAETMDNFASMSLSSNHKKEFRAEPQERRFSVPEVTDKPFLEVYTEDEINDFCQRIKEPDSIEIAEFGHFLLNRKPTNSAQRPLKGKYFFELCRMSMPEWKSFIIDYFINEGEIGVGILASTLKKQFTKIHGEETPFVTKKGSYESFLGDYLHEGKFRIGRVSESWDTQRRRDTFSIVPNEDFLRKFGKKYQDENSLDAL